MIKRMAAALLLATGAAYADTPPVLASLHECTAPSVPENGSALLAFTVTETGAVTGIRVARSSGNAESDARAMRCVAGYSFHPAMRNGVAVAAETTYDYRWGYVENMRGTERAFAALERDADHRCRRLFPIDPRFDLGANPITLVGVARLATGEVQTRVMQSAGPRADANAVKCVVRLLADHPDLPASFVRTIAVDWSHR